MAIESIADQQITILNITCSTNEATPFQAFKKTHPFGYFHYKRHTPCNESKTGLIRDELSSQQF